MENNQNSNKQPDVVIIYSDERFLVIAGVAAVSVSVLVLMPESLSL